MWKETRLYANRHTCKLIDETSGWHKVAPENCPENYGYNAIPLVVPEAGKEVEVEFRGERNGEEYHLFNVEKAGWRYGFVGVTEDGKSIYGDMSRDEKDKIRFVTPKKQKLAHLWLVVMGAPTKHWMNPQDKHEDAQWPYRIKAERYEAVEGSSVIFFS